MGVNESTPLGLVLDMKKLSTCRTMKSLKPEPKKKTLEPIPPKKPSTSKRSSVVPKSQQQLLPAPNVSVKSNPSRPVRGGALLPALQVASGSPSPSDSMLKIVVNASSPLPPDSPTGRDVTSLDSPHLSQQESADRSPNLTHQESFNDHSSSGGPSPLCRSMSGCAPSPMPELVGIGSNSSFDGRNNSFDATTTGLTRLSSRKGSMGNMSPSGLQQQQTANNTRQPGNHRLSVPGKSSGAAGTRKPRRKSSQQIQAEAAKKILFWWRSAAMRRNLKFLVAFIRRFVAIQEKARVRRLNMILRLIEKRLKEKLAMIRHRKLSHSRAYIRGKNTLLVQQFLFAFLSRATVGKARSDLRLRSVVRIMTAWRTSPRYQKLRLLEEQEEFFVLHKQEAVERRELARRWLLNAVELKNAFSARTVKEYVNGVLFRERNPEEVLLSVFGDDDDDEDSSQMSQGIRSRAESPQLRRAYGSKRPNLGSRVPSYRGSTMPSRGGSPTQIGNLRSLPSTVRRRIRSMSDGDGEESVALTPLWIEHLQQVNPVDAHLDKVDDEFFHPDRAQLIPCPGLKRKVCVSGSIIGSFWESWFVPLDGANVFHHQITGRSSSANARRSGYAQQGRKRTRFASTCESVRFIGAMAFEEDKRGTSPTTTRRGCSSPLPASMRPPSSSSARKPFSTDFTLSHADTMILELDVERLLIQERTTRLRMEGNSFRQVKDILEKMLTERQQELQDLLPHNQRAVRHLEEQE